MSRHGIDHRHCKWPLGMTVMVKTPGGYMQGKVNRHQKTDRRCRHGCDIAFEVVVDLGDRNGSRFCHHIPFRCIKPVGPVKRPSMPWYKVSKRG